MNRKNGMKFINMNELKELVAGVKTIPALQKRVDELSLQEIYDFPSPPKLPKRLPKLVASLVSKTPEKFRPTVAQAVFPALCIYPQKLEFLYLDNQTRELRCSCITVGTTGSGKDVCLRHTTSFLSDLPE